MKFKKRYSKILKNWPVKILCLIFALVLFQFYRRSLLDKRYFSVPLTIESNNLLPSSNYPRTVKIELWGEAIGISGIHKEDVKAYLDLEQYGDEGEHRVPVTIKLTGSALNIEPLEVSVDPKEIKVNLEPGVTKRVPVILSIKGNPAENYEISEEVINPPTVEIIGPQSVMEKSTNMLTESISIEGRDKDFDGQATLLNINPFVSILGKGQISYSVKIREALIIKEYKGVVVGIENLNDNLEVTSNIPTVSFVINGKKKLLNSWTVNDNFLKLDCSNITEPGIYDINVKVASSNKFTEIKINPSIIQLVIEEKKEKDANLSGETP
ncbi:MAG: hypothetical protein CR988_02980 [Treponema sp.]|nr:MAG: hypothetical protein CR988_02980 [Treponema sp.]